MTRTSPAPSSTARSLEDDAGRATRGTFTKTVVHVEHAKPGSALDRQLRREQASALIALLSACRERT